MQELLQTAPNVLLKIIKQKGQPCKFHGSCQDLKKEDIVKRTVLIFAVVLVLSAVSWAQMGGGMMAGAEQQAQQWGWGPGMMSGYGYGMGWFGSIIMVIFWVLVIVGLVFIIRWLAASAKTEGRGAKSEDSAIEILRKRYARGEIDKEEFEEKKKDLL